MLPRNQGLWFCKTPIAMTHCPFDADTHVKRKVEPGEGMSFWFADVPEGGVTENTYLSACVSFSLVFRTLRGFPNWLF